MKRKFTLLTILILLMAAACTSPKQAIKSPGYVVPTKDGVIIRKPGEKPKLIKINNDVQ